MGIAVNKQVIWEKRGGDLFFLPVLPYSHGLNYRIENLVVKICKRPVNRTFGSGTQVKYIPFPFTGIAITGHAQLTSADFIFPGVSQYKGF